MADLTFEVTPISELEATARVALSGAIDASTVITFQSELDRLKKEGIRHFLLDMSGIRYVNSTGLGSLVKLADSLESEGGMIALMQIHPKVKVVFDMLGLNAFFKIFKTDGDALDFFREQPAGGEEPLPPEEEAAPPPEAPPAVEAAPEPVEPAPEPVAVPEPLPEPEPVKAEPAAAVVALAEPVSLACQECGLNLRISHSGEARCARCFTLLRADETGKVEFLDRRRAVPLQVTLRNDVALVEGLASCVAAVAENKGLQGSGKAARDVVTATCSNIGNLAYGGSDKKTFQVLVEADNNELLLRFADHGSPLDIESEDFRAIREAATELSHVPHPNGGNILRISFKA